MKRLFYAFIFLLGMFSLNGQSVWIGAVDSEWTNPANWSAGVPTAGSVATIPANPVSPVFSGTPIINYTIQLAGDLTFNDFVFNAGTIIIFESGNVVNNGQFINANGQILDVDGHFENNGTLDNFGMVDIAASGSLDNETGGVFNNNNATLAFGPILNAGTTNNNGELNIIVNLDNNGEFNNFGNFESQAGSVTENRAGATTENFAGGSYSVNGIYNNLGSTFNAGDFIVQNASVFINDNVLINRTVGDMEVAGRIVNNTTFNINGPLMINSVGIIENNNQISNNGGIDIEICGNLIQLNTGNISGSIQNNGSVYEINGTINETNLEFGETFTDIDGRPAPVPACKRDAFLQLPESGSISFTAADIEQGRSYGSCGAQLVSITTSPNSFTAADVGVQIVTITVTDDFGNSASCDDFVTVLPFTPPIVPVDDPDITFDCPEDVMVTTQPGAQFAPASFIIPEATTTCSPSVGGSPVILCPDVSNSINGFAFLGQRGGSKYFMSHDAEDWFTANSIAQANGGQLVTIDDAAENAFITDAIYPGSGSIWTGLRSFDSGDNFSWESGAPVNYLNWSNGEPNNSGGDPNIAARLVQNTGLWTDRSTDDHFEFVIEISCFDVQIPGYDYLGSNEGSLYYQSHAIENWTNAANAATAIGGNLATISNAAENAYVQNAINPSTGSVWIGLTNNNNGNNFGWQSGEAVTYTNWVSGDPNETDLNVAARLIKSHGRWTDREVSVHHFEFLVEIPAPSATPTCVPTGTILREVWTDISGNSVSQIPVNTTPNLTEQIVSFETPTGFGDHYGTRVRGYIYPPVSGNYRFWIATDDNGELWLSTNDDPANRTRIANVPGFTTPRQWNKFPEQRSALIHLEAGERYYIEALQKEGAGGDNLAVRWRLPDGTFQGPIPGNVLSGIEDCNGTTGNGDPELTVTQIAGPQSGGNFPVGETPIVVEITDACGNQEICEFNVVVEENPAVFELTDCSDDITINTLPGASTAVPIFEAPSGSSTCFRGGPVSVVQNLGLESGEAFPIGNTQITYAVFDSCGNFEGCNFNVNVVEVIAAISLTCTEDVILEVMGNNSTVMANWTEPTATTDCFAGGLTSDQVAGPANGSDLPVGIYPIIYVFTDACNNTEVCTFNVVVNNCPDMDGDGVCAADDCDDNDANLPAAPGTACDDGDAGTENDVIGVDGCSCAGTVIVACANEGGDADGDGICADVDCDDTGTACDDGDAGTENDVIGADGCSCAGTMIVACANEGGDADGDGICAASLPATPGTACDDDDLDTENDVIGADGCSCSGTPITTDCNPTFVLSPGNITVNGLNGAFVIIKILDIANGYFDIVNCFGNCPTPASFDLPAGPYSLTVTVRDASGNTICDIVNEPFTIIDGCTPGAACNDGDDCTTGDVLDADCNCIGISVEDSDGDGFCAAEDCDDNNASVPTVPGTACDDGNASTENDVIGVDGCSCAGTLISTCTVAGGQIAFLDGSTEQTICADDGIADPLDVNLFGSIGSNQQWIITDSDRNILGLPMAPPFDLEGVFAGTCLIYSLSYDDVITGVMMGANLDGLDGCFELSNPVSIIRLVGSDCPGMVVDEDGDGVPSGEDCDDNDASVPAAPGTTCDDGDADTENDVIGADGCSCSGTPITTGCNPTFVLSPGNITINGLNGAFVTIKILDIANGYFDIVNCFGDCPTPASFDLPAGPYSLTVTVRDGSGNILCDIVNEFFTIIDGCTPGATCDDGDVCTTGDVFDADCNCIGTPLDDNDGDGFCAAEDCDDNNANLPATPGMTCDDGNPETTGDVYQADGCTCAGVIVGACNPTVTPSGSSLIIAGLSGPFNVIQIFNTSNWNTVINCFGDCYNQVVDVDPGNYFVRLRVLDDTYQEVCNIETTVTVSGSATFSIAPDTEFLHLFAREDNRAVELNWVNNSEYRNDYFVIERSIDGVNFTELKTVDAYGYENQEATNYEDQDFQPVLGDGFYRVRQVFEDGSLRYSNIEKVSFDIDLAEVGVFPNPAESEVQLSLVNFSGRSAVVQIYSPLGVLMDAVSVDEIPERALRFNVANYQAGLYTITVKVDQRKIFSKRFVKISM